MAIWSFSNISFTLAAVADATPSAANGAMFLQGGSTTQRIDVKELYMGGQAVASTPLWVLLARDSTVGVTSITLGTNGRNAALDPATAALAAAQVAGCSATTMPSRSSTLVLLNASFNAFGGIVRMNIPPGQEPKIVGNTASLGEVSLTAFTGGGGGLIGAHILYEPF